MRSELPRLALALLVPVLLLLSGIALGPPAPGSGAGRIDRTSGHLGNAPAAASSGPMDLLAAQKSLAAGFGPPIHPVAGQPGIRLLPPSPLLRAPPGSGVAGRPAASLGWHLLGSPESRYAGAMTYDVADGYVLEFGGDPDLGSTWTFANGSWTNATLTVHGSPPPRAGGAMVYDPALNETVLFGGYSFAHGGATLGDTWAYRAGNWTNVTGTAGTAPPARYFAGFAYDGNDSVGVLFGGLNNTSVPVDGTWEFAGGHWSNVSANQTSSPVSSQGPAFASDASDGEAVLFGDGTSSAPFQNQTWKFVGNRWTNLTSTVSNAPPGVVYAALSPATTAGGVLLFGGYGQPPNGSYLPTWRGESWLFSGNRWTEVGTGASAPAERELEMMADDPAGSGVLLYAGADYVAMTIFGDTWQFSAGAWTLLASPSTPTGREGASMAYDSTTHQVILFGGSLLNDTWSFSGGTWTELAPPTSPPRRLSAALADDPSDSGVVLFGGETLSTNGTQIGVLNDTWVFANGTWTNLTATAHGPSGRFAASIAYDSTGNADLLFGGQTAAVLLNETFAFHAGRWSQVALTGAAPVTREGAALGDDPKDSGVLLFGGYGCPPSQSPTYLCNDTWTYSAGAWTVHRTTRAPSVRDFAGVVDDPAFRGDVLVGGFGFPCRTVGNVTSCVSQPENDTWEYQSGTWTNLTGAVGAPPDGGLGWAFVEDSQDGYAFLFGSPGAGGGIGSGSWWSLSPGSATPLSVGTPTASLDPVAVQATTNLSDRVSGGATPYTVTWSGLPAGCVGPNATAFACTPTGTGEFEIRVGVTDRDGNFVTSLPLFLNVTAAALPIGSVTIMPVLANLSAGSGANLTAHAFDTAGHALSGATFAWTVTPTDLAALNASSGASVSLTAGARAGEIALTAKATYAGTSVPKTDNLAITKATGSPLALVSFVAQSSSIAVGATTTLTTVASGGTQPYAYAYSGLPNGCGGANAANLSCTPLGDGTSVVTVIVTDWRGAAVHANLTLTVTSGGRSTPGSATPVDWEIVGAGIALVAVAVLVGFLLARRRRPPAVPPAGPDGTG